MIYPLAITLASIGYLRLDVTDPIGRQPLMHPSYFKDNSNVKSMLEHPKNS